MINHYLLSLTPEAEDAVLTGKMAPGAYRFADGRRCLVGWAAGVTPAESGLRCSRPFYFTPVPFVLPQRAIEPRYDSLCCRFGIARVNNAIRNRILANQARRALAGVREAVAV